jgi:hypothetical protein
VINKHKKPTPVKVTAKATEETQPEVTQTEPEQEEKITASVEEVTPIPAPTPVIDVEPPVSTQPSSKPKPLTMASLKAEVDELHKHILDLTMQMADIKIQLALKRKPTANGKVQIRDKQTGKIYKSKNSVYQTMLKAGDLKDLVKKGIFGEILEKNTFGVYALFRAWPDRFEEVHETDQTPS